MTAGASGDRLRALRRSRGLSIEGLATLAGVSARAISEIERGRTRLPHPSTVRRIADALGIDQTSPEAFTATAGLELSAATPGHPATPRSESSAPVPRQLPAGVQNFTGRAAELAVLIPRELPGAVRDFVGRAGETAVLSQLLDQVGQAGPGMVVISAIGGTAGVGKTALALHWAHQVVDRFPDGQLHVNLRGFDPAGTPLSAGAAARRFLDSLGVSPESIPAAEEAQIDLYRSLLADRRMLVVLDNARDAEQVRPLLPAGAGSAVLITSRNELTSLVALDGARPLTLDRLSIAESRELLIGRLGSERVLADQSAAVDALIAYCARLPLALNIVAARALIRPHESLAELAGHLADSRSRLRILAASGDVDVRAVFSWSYQALSAEAARLFRLLGIHPGPDISAAAAASVTGDPVDQVISTLNELVRAHLIARDTTARYCMHDLLRAFAADLASGDSQLTSRAAARRIVDHYLGAAATCARLLDETPLPVDLPPPVPGVYAEPISARSQALDWFSREYHVLLGVVDLAAAEAFDVHAWQLPRSLRGIFEWRAQWHAWDHTHEIAAAAAARLADPRAEALTMLSWARCKVYQQDWSGAERILRRSLEQFEDLGDSCGQARALIQLGIAADGARQYEHAIAYAEQALALASADDNREDQAAAQVNLAFYQCRLGKFETARSLAAYAIDIFAELGNLHHQAMASHILGLTYHRLADYPRAIEAHRTAVSLLEPSGAAADLAEVMNDLADAYHAAGQNRQAVETCERAWTILDDLHHPGASQVQGKFNALLDALAEGGC